MNKTNNTYQIAEIVEILLDNDLTLEIKMIGYSMYPVLKNGEIGCVEKCSPDIVKQGDVLVFKRDGKYIAHRLMKMNTTNGKRTFVAKGDNNKHYDNPFYETDLIGKISHIKDSKGTKKPIPSRPNIRRSLTLLFPKTTTLINNTQLQVENRKNKYLTYGGEIYKNFRIVSHKSKKELIINAIIAIMQGILPFALIVCIKLLIDYLAGATAGEALDIAKFYVLLGLTSLVFLLNGLSMEFKSFWGEKLAQSVSKQMYSKVQRKHISLHLSHLENPKELDKIYRVIQEATYRPLKFINEILLLFKSIASSVLLAGLFISIKWYLVAILIIAVIPGVLVRFKFANRFHAMKDKQSPDERKMHYYNRILTGFPFAKELKLFSFSNFFLSRFDYIQKKLFTEKIDLRKSEIRWNSFSHLFSVALIFISLAYISYLKIQGEISIGSVILFFFAFQRGYSVLTDIFNSTSQLVEDNTYINDLRTFFDIEDKENRFNQTMQLKSSIRVENLSFRYETSQRDALKNINISIPAGKTIAIVGANGSGKSTFIKLLCGFYMPTAGNIYYDDIKTETLTQKAILKNTTAVFQDFALYNISALQNIALGNINSEPDIEKIKEAANCAGIDEVLRNLPNGYDTILGNTFNGGEELSMGQWQKMAVARAFYRDASLVIMDEPSSALDIDSENQIISSLRELAKNKTAIIISHRLTSVQWADEILLFDKGEIIEHGTHNELIALGGVYNNMYQAVIDRI